MHVQVWMDTRYKGFQLATLTHQKHHTEFITVPWGSKDYVPNCQYAFDLYATGALPLQIYSRLRTRCLGYPAMHVIDAWKQRVSKRCALRWQLRCERWGGELCMSQPDALHNLQM